MNEKQGQVIDLAVTLLRSFGLGHWSVRFNRRLSRKWGQAICPHPDAPGVVEISAYYLESADIEDLFNTVRHEVAHAIAYVEAGETGHGPAWVEACKRTGARPEPINRKQVLLHHAKWKAKCPSCDNIQCWTRRPTAVLERGHCIFCGSDTGKPLIWISKGDTK